MSCKSTYCECGDVARVECDAKLQASSDFETMCRVGYGCGLHTIAESYHNFSCHYDAFFLIEEAGARLNALGLYIESRDGWDKTIKGVKGAAWCEAQDEEEKAFWEAQQ